jgi:nitroreductase
MIVSWTSLALDQAIRERHSTRMFLPQPVPRELVDEALALAQYAPSNSNIQPWHVVFASGPPRDRLVNALLDEAQRRPPTIPPQCAHGNVPPKDSITFASMVRRLVVHEQRR